MKCPVCKGCMSNVIVTVEDKMRQGHFCDFCKKTFRKERGKQWIEVTKSS